MSVDYSRPVATPRISSKIRLPILTALAFAATLITTANCAKLASKLDVPAVSNATSALRLCASPVHQQTMIRFTSTQFT
jgi:hypothetical protein